MRKISYIVLFATLLMTGCYRDEFDQLSERIESLKGEKIAPLSEQVKSISGTISTLESLNSELVEYINELEASGNELKDQIASVDTELEGLKAALLEESSDARSELLARLEQVKSNLELELGIVNQALDALKEKNSRMEKKIAELGEYAQSNFATVSWANGTLSTIEKQNGIVSEVEQIKSIIGTLKESNTQLSDDVVKLLEDLVVSSSAFVDEGISAAIQSLSSACRTATENLCAEITAAFDNDLEKAVSESEKKIKKWVNEKLDDYYTVAQAEAKILAYKNTIGDVPAGKTIQGQIDSLLNLIGAAKIELTLDYKQIIETAIQTSEGKLTQDMDTQIQGLRTSVINPLIQDVTSLESQVSNLWTKFSELEGRINTLETQVKAINASIAVLDSLGVNLQTYVESVISELRKTDTTKYNSVKNVIDSLKTAINGSDETSLQSQISKLKAYVGTIPTDQTSIVGWVNNTKNDFEQSIGAYCTLETLNGLKHSVDSVLDSHNTRILTLESSVQSWLDDSESTIKGWINTRLGDFYTKTVLNKKLVDLEASLMTMFAKPDSVMSGKLKSLETSINKDMAQAKTDMSAYLANAIAQNGGYVTDTIETVISKAEGRLSASMSKLVGIESDINSIREDYINLRGAADTLRNKLDSLCQYIESCGFESLYGYTDSLEKNIAKLPTLYANLTAFNSAKSMVQTLKVQIDKVDSLVTDVNAAQTTIDEIKDFLAGYNLSSDTLQSLLKAITDQISALKTSVFGNPTIGLNKQIDALDSLLYGAKGTALNPEEGSIYAKISAISQAVMDKAQSVSSIVYVPDQLDGKAMLAFVGNKYVVNLDFLVRPAAVASIIVGSRATNKDVCRIKYVSTPTKGQTVSFKDFPDEDVSFTSDVNGYITATVSSSSKTIFESGISLALFVTTDKYSYVSEFVPVFVQEGNENFYVNPVSLNAPLAASKDTISIHVPNVGYNKKVYWTIEKSDCDSWVSCVSQGEGNTDVELSFAKNYTGVSRIGHLDVVNSTYGRRTVTINQAGRTKQEITGFSPASGTVEFSFNGYLLDTLGRYTSSKSVDVTVSTDDGWSDWIVENNGLTWLESQKKSGDDADIVTLSLSAKNETAADRDCKYTFKTIDNAAYDYYVKQKARGVQTLKFSPDSASGIPAIPAAGIDEPEASRKITVIPSDYENDWTVKTKNADSWLSIDKHISDGYVIVYSSAKTTNARQDTIVFTSSGTSPVSYEYIVKQDQAGAQTLSFPGGTSLNKKVKDGSYSDWTVTGAQTTVTYSSNNTAVATVNSSTGAVTIEGAGVAEISASAPAGNGWGAGFAKYTLTVTKTDQGIAFQYSKYNKTATDKDTTITVQNAKTAVSYKSSDTDVATVGSTSGTIHIKKSSSAGIEITAIAQEDKYYYADTTSYTLIIKKVAQKPTFGETTYYGYIQYGGNPALKATLNNSYGDITYSVVDKSIASIDSGGNITLYKTGTTKIKAVAAGNDIYDSETVEVDLVVKNRYKKVQQIVEGQKYILLSNDKVMRNDKSSTIGVMSKDNNFSVSSDGLLLERESDSLSVLWTASKHYDPYSKNSDYYIGHSFNNQGYYIHSYNGGTLAPRTLNQMTPDERSFGIGIASESWKSSIVYKYVNSKYLKFCSRNQNSLYALYYSSTTSEWYTYKDTETSLYIAPSPDKVNITGIDLSGGTYVAKGKTLQLSGSVTPSNAYNTILTWSSSDPNKATVDSNTGLVTGKSSTDLDPVTITVTAADGSKKAHQIYVVNAMSGKGVTTNCDKNGSLKFKLNSSAAWTCGSYDTSWFTISPTSGQKTSGDGTEITITINSDNFKGSQSSAKKATLTFTNDYGLSYSVTVASGKGSTSSGKRTKYTLTLP